MPAPQQWPRDVAGNDKDALFLTKAHTDGVLEFLEALATATVSPPGAGKFIVTGKKVVLKIEAVPVALPPAALALVQESLFDGVSGALVTRRVRVVRGTFNGHVFAEFSAGDSPHYKFDSGATGACWVKVETDSDGTVTARSILHGASTPADAPPADYTSTGAFYFELGTWSTGDDGAFHLSSPQPGGNLTFECCGGVTPKWGRA